MSRAPGQLQSLLQRGRVVFINENYQVKWYKGKPHYQLSCDSSKFILRTLDELRQKSGLIEEKLKVQINLPKLGLIGDIRPLISNRTYYEMTNYTLDDYIHSPNQAALQFWRFYCPQDKFTVLQQRLRRRELINGGRLCLISLGSVVTTIWKT